MSEKINWSKLSEMPPYAPNGPGRYVMRCGGVVEFERVSNVWMDSKYVAMYWNLSGMFCLQENHPFDIVAPAPDVLPWEECDQLEGLLVHANKEYASLLEACEADRQARLKLVEECERLKKVRNSLQKQNCDLADDIANRQNDIVSGFGLEVVEGEELFSTVMRAIEKYVWLQSERDNWKQYAEGLKQAIEYPRSAADIITELHGKQIADLLQRVLILEQYTLCHNCEEMIDNELNQQSREEEFDAKMLATLPAVTDKVQAEKEVV